MWLIVGLGNPGRQYEGNRHNVGFRVVDELARRANLSAWKGSKFGGETTSGMLSLPGGRQKVLLLKPMEYMNLSGFAVQRAAKFHDIEASRLVVIHDEIDLDFGKLRVKSGGGHGGHNGLRSIDEQMGTKDYVRVRVGVGKPGPIPGAAEQPAVASSQAGGQAGGRDKRVAGWVLSDFPAAIARQVDDLIALAADATEAILARGLTAAMNDFNNRAVA